MDKKSTPEELLTQELLKLQNDGSFPEKFCQMALDFIHCYRDALEEGGKPFDPMIPLFRLFFQFVLDQLRSPYNFEPYHQKVRHPFDYYRFSLDFIRPLIDLPHSKVIELETVDQIASQLAKGENAIFLANHQTETDPQAIAILLERSHPKLAEKIIYVAGDRVVTDPLAIPFSLGTDLLCIYSKRYIDHPPEQKAKKQLHNKNTMELMSRLLQEGGKAIYVAPSGGRDRKSPDGKIVPAEFDPNSVEMFYLMAKKAKTATHFYPLALDTYDLLPPPETIQVELGEKRVAKCSSIQIAFGSECNMETPEGQTKEERRKNRADRIWKSVCKLYVKIRK